MKHTITLPSKTFLIGEYAVLDGGPALLVNTTPRFECQFSQDASEDQNDATQWEISREGAVGNLFLEIKSLLRGYQLQFRDPHEGRGGFGASSAQYAALLAVIGEHIGFDFQKQKLQFSTETLKKIITTYQQHAALPNKPSGADLIAQLLGHITYYDPAAGIAETFAWPFSHLAFALIRTQQKVPTHVHLTELPTINTSHLTEIAKSTITEFSQGDAAGFCQGVNAYAEELANQKLVTLTTQSLLNDLKQQSFVRAAKGCGALGADVLLVLHESEHGDNLGEWTRQQSLTLIATQDNITHGLAVTTEN